MKQETLSADLLQKTLNHVLSQYNKLVEYTINQLLTKGNTTVKDILEALEPFKLDSSLLEQCNLKSNYKEHEFTKNNGSKRNTKTNQIVEGLKIINKYEKYINVCQTHDYIYAGNPLIVAKLNPSDQDKLKELNWCVNGSWTHGNIFYKL
jgi:hypothetical protein